MGIEKIVRSAKVDLKPRMVKGKVCMLVSSHSALDDRVFYKEALSLKLAGYDVTEIAPLDSEGFLYDMGKKGIAKDKTTIDGVNIIGYRKGGQLFNIYNALLILNLFGIGKIKLCWNPLSDLIDKAVDLQADIYHCHELWTLYAGIQIKKTLETKGKRPKLIYDVHEFRPAASSDNIKNCLLRFSIRKIIACYENRALRFTDHVITTNQIIRGYLLTANRFIRTSVIYNGSILKNFKELAPSRTGEGKVVICHEGNLPFDRGLKLMIEVMGALKARYGDRVELQIIGDVFGEEREYLENKLEEDNLHDVIKRTGWLPYERVGEAISHTDIGIIFMEPTINNMLAGPPNKLFNYMMCGVPVVSVDLPETSRIISEDQCGLIVRDRSLESVVGALSSLIDNQERRQKMGGNGKQAVQTRYSWEHMEKKLLNVYDDLLAN